MTIRSWSPSLAFADDFVRGAANADDGHGRDVVGHLRGRVVDHCLRGMGKLGVAHGHLKRAGPQGRAWTDADEREAAIEGPGEVDRFVERTCAMGRTVNGHN